MSGRDVCLSHCKACRIEYGRANFCDLCRLPTEPGELFSPLSERELFELAVRNSQLEHSYDAVSFQRSSDGTYLASYVEAGWFGWRAAKGLLP